MERLLSPASENGDVLACLGVDAFERPAVGVEVPEVVGHSDGASAFRIPGGGQARVYVRSCHPLPPEHAIPLTQQPGYRSPADPDKDGQGIPWALTERQHPPLPCPQLNPDCPDKADTPITTQLMSPPSGRAAAMSGPSTPVRVSGWSGAEVREDIPERCLRWEEQLHARGHP